MSSNNNPISKTIVKSNNETRSTTKSTPNRSQANPPVKKN